MLATLLKKVSPLPLAATLLAGLAVPAFTQAAQKEGGNDHGGGGNLTASTNEEIRKAIEKVLGYGYIASKINALRFYSTLSDPEYRKPDDRALKVMKDFLIPLFWIDDRVTNIAQWNEKAYFLVQLWDSREESAWKKGKIELKESGSCGGIHGDAEADASVSALSFDATLCFSLERLRRIPAPNLEVILRPLVFHELAHLNGLGEDDAVRVQKKVAEAPDLELKLERNETKMELYLPIAAIQNEMGYFRIMPVKQTEVRLLYTRLGRIERSLEEFRTRWLKLITSARYSVHREHDVAVQRALNRCNELLENIPVGDLEPFRQAFHSLARAAQLYVHGGDDPALAYASSELWNDLKKEHER